ncbi:hypothetical protein MPSEU_000340500 [Mayamaea pseudoterrestris]|nr:hypothetical protein MPSEU_000340500 [Mayamaea pseudoterrestris]
MLSSCRVRSSAVSRIRHRILLLHRNADEIHAAQSVQSILTKSNVRCFSAAGNVLPNRCYNTSNAPKLLPARAYLGLSLSPSCSTTAYSPPMHGSFRSFHNSSAKQSTSKEEIPSAEAPAAAEANSQQAVEYSTPELARDAAKHKAGITDPDRPLWQNPLHHNNEEMNKIFREDFESDEAFEAAVQPAPPLGDDAPAYIQELAEEMVNLTLLEMNELVNKIAHHYGFHDGMLSPDDGEGGAGGADDDDESNVAAPAKTAFDVKLVSFDDKAKIKVIKEVRAIAGLGLKEAKEMVEGAPKIVLKQIKQEQADEIKAKLEELGAVIEIV